MARTRRLVHSQTESEANSSVGNDANTIITKPEVGDMG